MSEVVSRNVSFVRELRMKLVFYADEDVAHHAILVRDLSCFICFTGHTALKLA